MTPKPEDYVSTTGKIESSNHLNGERVVISGMSGMFPKSHSVKELSEILYNKINPIEPTSRFIYNHPEVVQCSGNVPGLSYFDAQFFKVHYRLANCMDPMGRKVLEHSYQAIYDAGINPEDLSGKKVGVYIGSCFSEAEKACFYEANSRTGFGIAGCSKTMFANRISYWLNAKGPSMSIDEACCSSTAAIEQAYLAINRGECEAAIVGGTYLCLHPQSSVHYGRMIKLSSDDKTKSFDKNADGCVKSECINVLFLQKASNAFRIYADVVYAKTEFTSMIPTEIGPKFGFSRNFDSIVEFIRKFYKDSKISPQAVEYVEAFGSANPEDDKTELEALAKVLCQNRNNPLLIGSVVSNIGYTEAASGIAAVIKVLLGYHNGKLAGNLHCEHPREDVSALRDGKMQILQDHQNFNCTYTAVNGMAVTGTNSHVLLRGYRKPKDLSRYKSSIPYLVNISGRHEEAVKYILKVLKSNPIDSEQLALLHNIHQSSTSGHMGRGFLILDTDAEQKTVSLFEKSEYFDDMNRPLWFVYSGMGSQWAGMGTALLRIPIFAAAIERCHKALKPKGLDIVKIITTEDETIFNNILHSFVGIAAIQIGLTDVLHAIGLKPQGIIGHSVGELGCAYADGCLTAEEMILSAYYRGLVSLETKFIFGSMAAVGMGYDQISKLCPSEIEVACHNGPDSSTISGPADVMRAFVAELTKKQIFAREVPCSNIAYHSRYIADAGPGLLKYLKKAIPDPKPRSKRWISSSVPESRWGEPIAKSCSPEYLTNNLLSPVLFDETSQLIPKNAVLVEIAPHGLLQAILKRSMPESCVNIPLTRRKHNDNVVLLLQAIGNLYMEGYNSNLQALYPKVEMPVSTGTPFLSDFVKWAHGESWPLAVYRNADRKYASICDFVVSLHDKEQAFLQGHSVRGKILHPFSASLMLAWDTLAMIMGAQKKQLSVTFTDIHLHAQPVLHNRRQLKLHVSINVGTGWFEILDGNSKVVTGFIKATEQVTTAIKDDRIDKIFKLTSEHVYELLADRDYSYSGEFQSIHSVDESLNEAQIKWKNNWVTFLDGILQFNMLRQTHDAVALPTLIGSIIIDIKRHSDCVCNLDSCNNDILVPVNILEQSESTRCGGILVENIIYQNLPKLKNNMTLKTLRFISNYEDGFNVSSSLEVFLRIVAENVNKNILSVIGIPSNHKEGYLYKEINHTIKNISGLKVIYKEINNNTDLTENNVENTDLILVQNLSCNDNLYQKLQHVIRSDQFIVSEENIKRTSSISYNSHYKVLSVHAFEQNELRLVRWKLSKPFTGTTTISLRNTTDFEFIRSVLANLAVDHRLLIISSHPVPSGFKEFVASLRQGAKRDRVFMVAVNYDDFNDFEEKLNDVELAFNVVHKGELGGEFYLTLEEKAKVTNVKLQSLEFGGHDSLHWVEAPALTTAPGLNVTVQYAGITTHDVKKASGLFLSKQNVDNSYGLDFSGVTASGERVMGIVTGGSLRTQVRAVPELLWPVPNHWSLEDAATVPLAYMQAFYCFGIKAPLLKSYSVLVHGGAGAFGQAVINILLANDCEVFTTVSDINKKEFLLKAFPALKADHIGCSRDDSFGNMVLSAKRGCDIVISCVKENLKNLNMNCMTFGGICCDISQVEDHDDYKFGMSHLNEEKNYVCIDFSGILDIKNNKNEIMILSRMLCDGITNGSVRPLSRVTYEPSEVSHAFRLLGSSQHRGRVLLHMDSNNVPEQNRILCNAENCHLILGDSVKFGIQFADLLISRGVKKICMVAQTLTPYLQQKIRLWRHSNVEVIVFSDKLNELKNVHGLLQKVLRLGTLEGVYITSLQDNENIADVINNLDSASRVLCPKLRYFTIVNVGDQTVGKDVCIRRQNDKLPANVLLLPELKNALNTESVKWRGAVDATEQALQSSHTVLLAHSKQESEPTILQRIVTISGIPIADDADKNLTLQDLGVSNLADQQLEVICSALKLYYNLSFNKEQLSTMTLETIRQLEKTITELPYEDSKGLRTFFNHVDPDELLATTEIVLLPTLASSASMRGDEFDSNQKYLYVIPGMEGHHERYRILCERLKFPAAVLQPGLDNPHETVDETAERYAQVLLKKHVIKDTFYLLGHESGIYIALKLAAILEQNGLIGKVYCLGCSPADLQQEIELQLAEYKTEDQLFDAVVKHMFTLMTGNDNAKLDVDLSSISTRSEKVEIGVRALLGRVPHSAQYARDLIETAVSRILQLRRFKPLPVVLRSQVIFLRAKTIVETTRASSLQQYSEQPVIVHSLEAPLAECAADLRCANFINEHFDAEILEQFAKRNICDSYILNPDSFMCVVHEQE